MACGRERGKCIDFMHFLLSLPLPFHFLPLSLPRPLENS